MPALNASRVIFLVCASLFLRQNIICGQVWPLLTSAVCACKEAAAASYGVFWASHAPAKTTRTDGSGLRAVARRTFGDFRVIRTLT